MQARCTDLHARPCAAVAAASPPPRKQETSRMHRRSLIKHTGLAGVLASGVAPAVHAQATLRWRIASSFPKSSDTIYGGAQVFAKAVRTLSGGKFEISVHPGGELMPPFDVVDGVQSGAVEMCHAVPYYFY